MTAAEALVAFMETHPELFTACADESRREDADAIVAALRVAGIVLLAPLHTTQRAS